MSDSTDPWGSTSETTTIAEPATGNEGTAWGVSEQSSQPTVEADWLAASKSANTDFNWMDPFENSVIPLGSWVDSGLTWVVENFRPLFQAIRVPIDTTLTAIEAGLLAIPALVIILIFGLIAWQVANKRLAIVSIFSLVAIGLIGAWSETMVTLSLVLTSVFFSLVIGLPIGCLLYTSPSPRD